MARILNIETSTEICSVSISENGLCKYLKIHNPESEMTEKASHSKLLAVFIDQILTENNLKPVDIDAVAISAGPGSYTGLRIGVSTAKGFCFGTGIPLIAVDTLLTVAAMLKSVCKKQYDYIIPMTDARRMEVYCCIFDTELNLISKTEAKVVDETSFSELSASKVVFCGNGAEKCMEIMNKENFFVEKNVFPSAEYMSEFSEKFFNEGKFADLVYFEPFYLKDFVATTPRDKFL